MLIFYWDSTARTVRPYKWVGHNKRYLSACRPIVDVHIHGSFIKNNYYWCDKIALVLNLIK